MKTTRLSPIAYFAAIATAIASAACGASSDDQGPSDPCSGTFQCSGGTAASSDPLPLHRDDTGTCIAGKFSLDGDGHASVDSLEFGEWYWTTQGLAICYGSYCVQCIAGSGWIPPDSAAPGADTLPASGACEGSARRCSELEIGTCHSQDGCHMGSHVDYEGNVTPECKGEVTQCYELTSPDSCNEQDGCRWR